MPQATWKGTITFGLVSIPVKMITAAENRNKIEFRQIHEATGNRVAYQRVDAETGDVVGYDDIIKGYEISKGQYVLIEPKELEALAPDKTNSISVEAFVDVNTVDPVYFDKAYLLVPDGADKPYALLRAALMNTDLDAVGRFVLRSKEYLCIIRPVGSAGLALQTLHWADEVRHPDTVIGEVDTEVSEAEITMARTLVDAMHLEQFNLADFHDEYREQVMALIEAKSEGKAVTVTVEPEAPKVEADLMASLAASVEAAKRRREAKAAGDDG